MDQDNLNIPAIPVVRVGDTIYESCSNYGNLLKNLLKRKVERITKTQIILDRGTKLRNNPIKMLGDREDYYLDAVKSKDTWNRSSYYLETEERIAQYKHEQLFLKTQKMFESLDLKKLTDEQLNILLSTITQITIAKEDGIETKQ